MKLKDLNVIEHSYKTISKLVERKKTTEIILHCSATPEGKEFTVETIDKWHKDRKFACIGYQYVIYLNGDVHQGRGEEYSGAHCTDHNSKSIGICYIGGLAKDGKTAKDTRTDEQKESLYQLVEYLLEKYHLSINDVHGHYEFAQKACPSFKIEKFRDEFNKWKEKKYEEKLKKQNEKVPVCNVKNWYKN